MAVRYQRLNFRQARGYLPRVEYQWFWPLASRALCNRHMCVNNLLAQSRYVTVKRPAVKPMTSSPRVWRSVTILLLLIASLLERCRVHHWSPGLPTVVAFFHADERLFRGFKSASIARSRVWLGLTRFQSEGGFWIADAGASWCDAVA